jgi:hypothetical protein
MSVSRFKTERVPQGLGGRKKDRMRFHCKLSGSHRSVSSFFCVASLFFGLTSAAMADTFTATASLSGSTASVGNPVLASVDFGSPFVSIDGICFQFTFSGDLLDGGDFFRVTPLNLLPSLNGPGAENPGSASQDVRTLCVLTAFGYGPFTSLFLDGAENRIEIGMENGSVTIADLQVIIMGVKEKTTAVQLADLLAAVTGIAPGSSLADKVFAAQAYFASGNLPSTCSMLTAFLNEVNAQSGKNIPATTATALIANAVKIKSKLGC